MKKAKDYANEILAFKDDEELLISAMSKAVRDMMVEIGELTKARNIKRKSALKSIILEQDRKWKAICRLINLEGMSSSFLDCLQKAYPLIWREAGF